MISVSPVAGQLSAGVPSSSAARAVNLVCIRYFEVSGRTAHAAARANSTRAPVVPAGSTATAASSSEVTDRDREASTSATTRATGVGAMAARRAAVADRQHHRTVCLLVRDAAHRGTAVLRQVRPAPICHRGRIGVRGCAVRRVRPAHRGRRTLSTCSGAPPTPARQPCRLCLVPDTGCAPHRPHRRRRTAPGRCARHQQCPGRRHSKLGASAAQHVAGRRRVALHVGDDRADVLCTLVTCPGLVSPAPTFALLVSHPAPTWQRLLRAAAAELGYSYA